MAEWHGLQPVEFGWSKIECASTKGHRLKPAPLQRNVHTYEGT